MTDQEIGQRLEKLRMEAQMSVAQVAAALGITEVGYRFLERGKTGLKLSRMISICELYGLKPESFFVDPSPIDDNEINEAGRLVGPIIGPAFNMMEELNKTAVGLQTLLKEAAALKHGLDRIGVKGKRSGRKFT